MNIGIDKIGFYTPNMYLEMADLAVARGVEPAKFTVGLGQEQMAVPPLYEDAVTMAANAALSILTPADKEAIDMILVGSESGIDNSKSIGVYVQSLAGLNASVRAVELKQACYGATMGLLLAKGHVALNPAKKVLVIATDIAKYGLNTPGESTQGAGAVAMIVSKDPKVAILESDTTCLTEDIMDFWRPVYSDYAYADGKFSTQKYMGFFASVWQAYTQQTQQTFSDFAAICFHQPFTKLGKKALTAVFESEQTELSEQERLLAQYDISTIYNKRVGNIYTGSLYLSLVSLLEQSAQTGKILKGGDRIGLFSYGSGAVGEFFVLRLQNGFEQQLQTDKHLAMLAKREQLDVSQYEAIYQQTLVKDGSQQEVIDVPSDRVVLTGVAKHTRLYRKAQV